MKITLKKHRLPTPYCNYTTPYLLMLARNGNHPDRNIIRRAFVIEK